MVLWLYNVGKSEQAGTQSHWKSLIQAWAPHGCVCLSARVCVLLATSTYQVTPPLLKSHYLLIDITLALVTTVLCTSGYIYCVCVYMCAVCVRVDPHDSVYYLLPNTACVKVWESNAMRRMQRLSIRSSFVCVMSAKQQGIHSYRWDGNSGGRAIHTQTHITFCEGSCHVPRVEGLRYFPMKWVSEKTLD